MVDRTGEHRSPLEGLVCATARFRDERVECMGVVVGDCRVLVVVPRHWASAASFGVRFPGDARELACQTLLAECDGEVSWALLDCPGASRVRALLLDEEVRAGADCHIFQRVGLEPVVVPGRMSYMATVDPVQAPLMVRPAEVVQLDAVAGSPCLVNRHVVGLLTGRCQAGRAHMLTVIPSALIVDRCMRLGATAGLFTLSPSRNRVEPPPWPRHPPAMVGWYEPGLLVTTAISMIISKVFGEYDDRRAMEGGSAAHYEHALSPAGDGGEALWLDYVADTGDGFDATYAVASAVSLPWLPLRAPDGTWEATQRGHVLIFGGDQVYPLATPGDYQRRFVAPFRLAATGGAPRINDPLESVHPWSRLPPGVAADVLPNFDPRTPWRPDKEFIGADDGVAPVERTPPRLPWVLALPGNHDWYDNLVQFMKIFASGERFAEWNPVQSRSYFLKKLPWGWWIFGVDVQLTGDLDPAQLRYFLDWVDAMRPGDKAILCVPEPHWLDDPGRAPRVYLNVLETALENGGHLKLTLAGDLHHYRRHEDAQGRQKIVAGGGGAFLHATHPTAAIETLPRRPRSERKKPLQVADFTLKKSFPSSATSRRLAFLNLFFPLLNWGFTAFLGALYLLASWLLVPGPGPNSAQFASASLHTYSPSELGEVLRMMTNTALINPLAGLYLLALVAGIRSLSNTPSGLYNWVAGILHGLIHVVCVFITTWLVAWLTVVVLKLEVRSTAQLLVGAPLTAVAGGLLGGLVMGLYLWGSSTFFGLHQNEAFSSIRNADWKCFLRLKFTPDSVTIYPVGFRSVPRTWKPRKGDHGPARWPAAPVSTRPFLIEAPLVLHFGASAPPYPAPNHSGPS